jgi:hypothetical protein
MGAAFLTWPMSKRWLRNWGSTPSERTHTWVGDKFVPNRRSENTRAIDISAPAQQVWDRIVQLGLGRAGFYSYELLERIVGIPVTNIESVEPEWQSLSVGDEVLVHPKAGFRVSEIAEGRHVCFGTQTENGIDKVSPDIPQSWSLYVEPVSPSSSRLIIRSCFGRPKRVTTRIAAALGEPVDFVMEQRMLRTIKRLCEMESSESHTREAQEEVPKIQATAR